MSPQNNGPHRHQPVLTAGEPLDHRQEMTIGCNIYIIGHLLKWQNDVTWSRNSLNGESLDDFTGRSQFQVAF